MITLLEVLDELRKEGYTADINGLMRSANEGHTTQPLLPQKFTVDKWYRIDDQSDPASQTIVYAVSANSGSIKGIVVNGYGAYTDPANDKIMEMLELHPEENKLANEQ